jgi:uncharacterized protein YbdZ (MbtH family)
MTKGFIFSEPQRKRESVKAWVHHFASLGREVHLLRAVTDGKYSLWREGEQVPTGKCCTIDELLESGAYKEEPHEDLLPPAPWQYEITTA